MAALDTSGNLLGESLYYAYGSQRLGPTGIATDRLFTGQRAESGVGLYDYAARLYDPLIGRFISADSIVPKPGNPRR